ncbi:MULTISPECIES: AMP-dependent synthetase/ligase [unclassified Streptomyces]|uniref:AMP-dependent synthetase/ligase n=1 Tax=unclassified Streptomyces TaxID=2593676 RepID=UPI0007ECF1F9|nr:MULTISPECIES: AMP-dependent synthetase/ligase [unclassified Streptomyces]MCP3767900.1 AMP-dependent synthetase/ligase [Streptomyces sp. MAR25Y5]OBQ53214.1 AMP-dependent synthetase [Streptomyces sp. H-KF8]
MTPAPSTDGERAARSTLPLLVEHNARAHPDLPALSWRKPDGEGWATLDWAQVREHTGQLAAGYAALGVGRGDHVLLMMANRPEHWLSDLALVRLGAVPVSVYGTSAPEQIAHIARNCRAAVAVVEGAAQAGVWAPLLDDGATPLARLVVVEPGEEGPHLSYAALTREPVPEGFGKALDTADPDDPLTVVYTSGTTGEPKGVVLTHRQVIANALALDAAVELPPHVEHICYLPFAHIAERMLGIYLPCHRASHVYLCADPTVVAEAVREVRPRQFFGVPRIWEKLAVAVRAGLAMLPEEQRHGVEKAMEVAREHVGFRERGETPPPALEEAYARMREKVLQPLLAAGGLDRVTWTASASAPMSLDVVRFWSGLGVVIMDAWGLTETTGVATTNSPRTGFRLGSVGRPVSSVEVRLAEDGEIEVRGASVFSGYLQQDGSVRSVVDDDGWLATGDVGRIDDDGYVWLTDRKKEMIVTSTGKNVSPALVENALKEHPLIGQALVHGDNRSYLVALLVLDPEAAPAWAAAHGVDADDDLTALAAHPAVRAEVDRAVAAANTRLNRTEQVKRYRLLAREWGPATGELTPSLKMRRRVIRDRHATELTELYAD